MTAFLGEKIVRARKRYRCYVCQLRIEPGDRYARSVTIDNGTAHTFREHRVCRDAAMLMLNEHRGDFIDGYHGEDVRDWLADMAGSGDLEDPAELRAWLRVKRAWTILHIKRRLARA